MKTAPMVGKSWKASHEPPRRREETQVTLTLETNAARLFTHVARLFATPITTQDPSSLISEVLLTKS